MTNLVIIQENKSITTSKMVAEAFQKQHFHVIRDIETLECSADFHASNFGVMLIPNKIGNGAVRNDKVYNMTRDGFTFLAMGYTGKRAAEFKEAYIAAFNEMEKKLFDQQWLRMGGFQDEDFIMAQCRLIIDQAQSVIRLKGKVNEIEEKVTKLNEAATVSKPVSPPDLRQPTVVPRNPNAPLAYPVSAINDGLFTVAEYMVGKNFTNAAKAYIGYCARRYSAQHNLTWKIEKTVNRYTPKAIEHGLGEAIINMKPYLNDDTVNGKLIKELKNNPVAQELIKLSVGKTKNYRGTMKHKLKALIYNKLNKHTEMRFSLCQNASWINIKRLS